VNQELKYPAIFLLGAQGKKKSFLVFVFINYLLTESFLLGVGKSTLGNMLLGCYSSYSETKVLPIFPISDGDDEKEEVAYSSIIICFVFSDEKLIYMYISVYLDISHCRNHYKK
jgi:hypothetical protein